MRIFEFSGSFVVIDGIRCVIIEDVKKPLNTVVTEEDYEGCLFRITIAYENDSKLFVIFDNEKNARETYQRLMKEVKDYE